MKFGTVDTGLWSHPDFLALDDDSKLLFLHLKTCDRMNMIGCFHMPIAYMAENLNWGSKRVEKTLSKLSTNGFVTVDIPLKTVFLPKHLSKHPLQNPNQAKGAEKLFNELPKRFKYINELAEVLLTQTTLSKPFTSRLQTLCNSVTVSVTTTVTSGGTEKVPPTPCQTNKKLTLKKYLEFCNENKLEPIPEDSIVFDNAEKLNLPSEFVFVAWQHFKDHWTKNKSHATKSDWVLTFNNCLKDDGYGAYRKSSNDEWYLTTKGKNTQILMEVAA